MGLQILVVERMQMLQALVVVPSLMSQHLPQWPKLQALLEDVLVMKPGVEVVKLEGLPS